MTTKGMIIASILLRWRGAAVTGAPLFERAEALVLPSIVSSVFVAHSLIVAAHSLSVSNWQI